MPVQPDFEHEPPGQLLPQYELTERHQLENWKQFRLSGKPACKKHDAT